MILVVLSNVLVVRDNLSIVELGITNKTNVWIISTYR